MNRFCKKWYIESKVVNVSLKYPWKKFLEIDDTYYGFIEIFIILFHDFSQEHGMKIKSVSSKN